MAYKTAEILHFVGVEGCAPFHPTLAFEPKRFEGNPLVGKEWTMEFHCRTVTVCDEFWLFGIDEETIPELRAVLQYNAQHPDNAKRLRLFYQVFDNEWERHVGQFKDLVEEARRQEATQRKQQQVA